MKKKVEWFAEWSDGTSDIVDISLPPFDSLDMVSADIMKNYPNYDHYQCPAFQDSLNNTFILRCPIDISIKVNKKNNVLQISSDACSIPMISGRPSENTRFQLFSFQYFFTFISKHDDIMVEQLPALYHKNDFTDKCQIIIGRFNIGKWIRPIEMGAVMITSESEEDIFINIKKGDAISYIRFICDDNIVTKRLEDIVEIKKILEIGKACTDVKKFSPRLSLKKLYDLFKPYNPIYKKSCPFNIFKK